MNFQKIHALIYGKKDIGNFYVQNKQSGCNGSTLSKKRIKPLN